MIGYALNSVIQAYPEAEAAIRSKLTPRGEDLLFKVKDQCIAETIAKFMFRHLQPYFNEPISDLMQDETFKGLFDLQRIGTLRAQRAGADQQQPLRPAGAVDGGQPAGTGLVRARAPTSSSACWSGKCPRVLIALRIWRCSPSIVLVV